MAFPKKITKISQEIGKAGLHALYPKDFEYYAVTLELTDSAGTTVEYLTFPVNPNSMSYNNQTLVNVKKTMAGVSALDNETFQPRKIEIVGTFGRKFKILLNNELGEINIQNAEDNTAKGQFDAISKNAINVKEAVFDPKLKTGYGTIKVLESIVEKSRALDKYGKSYRLFLYNPALGHSWLVKVNSIGFSMDKTSSNMLWDYNLQLTALAPLNKVKTESQSKATLKESTGMAALQNTVNILTSKIRSSF